MQVGSKRDGTKGETPRRAKPPRTRNGDADANATRNRILDVAMREFAENGFAGARVDRIAQRAGVNKQLLYYYFDDKKGLYDAAIVHVEDEYQEFYAGGPETERYVDRLVRYARGQNAPHHTLWRRMLLWEALQDAPPNVGDAGGERWREAVAQIKAAQDDGALDPSLDTEMLTLAMVGLVHLPHVMVQGTMAITGHLPSDEAFVERHAQFIASFIPLLAARD